MATQALRQPSLMRLRTSGRILQRYTNSLGLRGNVACICRSTQQEREGVPGKQHQLEPEDGSRAPQQQQASRQPKEHEASSAPAWQASFVSMATWFQELTTQQKAWVVAAVLGFLVILPRAAVLILVGAERLLVGSLLATEALLASLLLRMGLVAGALALLGLVVWGFYAFVLEKRPSDS